VGRIPPVANKPLAPFRHVMDRTPLRSTIAGFARLGENGLPIGVPLTRYMNGPPVDDGARQFQGVLGNSLERTERIAERRHAGDFRPAPSPISVVPANTAKRGSGPQLPEAFPGRIVGKCIPIALLKRNRPRWDPPMNFEGNFRPIRPGAGPQ